MQPTYIPRTLVKDAGKPEAQPIFENDILTIPAPIVILGDPGLGKSYLMERLAKSENAKSIAGGTFYRSENIDRFRVTNGKRIVIDGLDEIASASGGTAVDEVLKKLSRLDYPTFIISCRTADWQGSVDRYRIRSDYGVEPVTLLLQPFTRDEAHTLLSEYVGPIDATSALDRLHSQDLDDFYGNPLTLNLIGELIADGQGLPESRYELFNRASELLTRELNVAHKMSVSAQSAREQLLHSAGAAYAHLILSGSIGITDMPSGDAPVGFISIGEFANVSGAELIEAVLRTRLVRSVGESLFIPFHRVIAEFIGARYLADSMSRGLSSRRVFQALTFADGVPTSFRGIHAWLSVFNPAVADTAIKRDPYGVLRYGEPERLSDVRARRLLEALTALAKEDPYFRNEEWGQRAISGLARPQLKKQIVDLIRSEDKQYQLSTLILQALPGTSLTKTIAPELISIVKNERAVYAERINAAHALIGSTVNVRWSEVVERLIRESADGRRLSMEIISTLKGAGFSGRQISEVILEYQGVLKEDNSDRETVGAVDWFLAKSLDPKIIKDTLNQLAARISSATLERHWNPGNEFATTVQRLIERLIEGGFAPKANELWSWLKMLRTARGYSSEPREKLGEFFRSNDRIRRSIQTLAFFDPDTEEPWMAIAHYLPSANQGLAVSQEDAVEYLQEIAAKQTLSNSDVTLWAALVLAQRTRDGFSPEVMGAINAGLNQHSSLKTQYQEITRPPARDWEKEHAAREAAQKATRQRNFTAHRNAYRPFLDKIENGSHSNALHQMASGYLKRFYDLDNDISGPERLKEWLGAEIADAALAGFRNYLRRNDLPTMEQVSALHSESKHYHAEPIMTCGVLEYIRLELPIESLPRKVLETVLASWWEFPDFNADKHGEEIRQRLETIVFDDNASADRFLRVVMEPRLKANQDYIPGLHQLGRDERFKGVAGALALEWLNKFPGAKYSTQETLIECALQLSNRDELATLIQERRRSLAAENEHARRLWLAVWLVADFDRDQDQLSEMLDNDQQSIWAVRELVRLNDASGNWPQATLEQCAFILRRFAKKWPVTGYPRSGWSGDHNAWDASDFLRGNIQRIGASPSDEASELLDRLCTDLSDTTYAEILKHHRAQQRRLRRDVTFSAPSFTDIKNTLSNSLPGGIDDLKAMLLDRFEELQKYILDGDTNPWAAFSKNGIPHIENECRDRFVDLLRPRLPLQISILPETLMPEQNRADIVAIYEKCGLPVEVKGQWHPNLWEASSVQLIEKYGRDWRAYGRGIYLVFWFKDAKKKKITPHPDGLSAPTSPRELKKMLESRLTAAELSRIDVVIIDASWPVKPASSTKPARKRARRGK